MLLNVYPSQGNHYVLIPGCLLPSLHCQSLHGPLRLRGSVFIADFPNDLDWSLVLAKIDRQTFALASVAEARRLLGGDHDAWSRSIANPIRPKQDWTAKGFVLKWMPERGAGSRFADDSQHRSTPGHFTAVSPQSIYGFLPRDGTAAMARHHFPREIKILACEGDA